MAEVWLNQRANSESSFASTVHTHDNIPDRMRRRTSLQTASVRFAHPAETAIAALFDAFGVRWLYEPTTFPLVTAKSGLPFQSFTPDFYLPDHGTYIEMTTMRQSLVTRKNRKFRLMRELYPDIDVRLLYRKDVELILNPPGLERTRSDRRAGTDIANGDQIQRKVREVAAGLREHTLAPLELVALGTGAVPFRDAIATRMRATGTAVGTSTVLLPGRRATTGETSFAIDVDDCRPGPVSRRVLVVDVLSTGLTAFAALRWLQSANLAVNEVVALLDRRSARLIEIPLAVPAMACPSVWVAGFGLGPLEFATLPGLRTIAA